MEKPQCEPCARKNASCFENTRSTPLHYLFWWDIRQTVLTISFVGSTMRKGFIRNMNPRTSEELKKRVENLTESISFDEPSCAINPSKTLQRPEGPIRTSIDSPVLGVARKTIGHLVVQTNRPKEFSPPAGFRCYRQRSDERFTQTLHVVVAKQKRVCQFE